MQGSQFFQSYKDIPDGLWRWPNFTPKEIASKGNGSILIHFDSLDKLQAARTAAGKPFIIDSAYRDEKHNELVGGKPGSFHLLGRAFDIRLHGFTKNELHKILVDAGFTGFGLNYETFIHADTGGKRTW